MLMTEFEKATIEVKQIAVDEFRKELIDRITTVYEHEYEYLPMSGECNTFYCDAFYQDIINIIKNS